MIRSIIAVLALVLVSCGPRVQKSLPKGESSIVGGTEVEEGSPITASVVGIWDSEFKAICTGSIVAENVVVTAAHCIGKPQHMYVVFGNNVDEYIGSREPDVREEHVRQVTDVRIHSDYDDDESQLKDERGLPTSDIAVLKFVGKLPAGYAPANVLPVGSALQPGVQVLLVGYGVSEVIKTEIDITKKEHLDPSKYDVMCSQNDGDPRCYIVEMEGDGILRQAVAQIESLNHSEVIVDETRGSGTCSGDSGGPAYVLSQGRPYLFGVTSRGSQMCDGYGVYTNVLDYYDWIQTVIQSWK